MKDSDGLPVDAEDLRLLVHALLDGELDAATAMALERRLETDTALAAERDRIAALKGAVQRIPRPEVSDAFRARIAAIGGMGAPVQSAPVLAVPVPRRMHAYDWRAMAASIILTAFVVSGATYWAVPRNGAGVSEMSIADAVANGHRRSLLAASPIDIATSDRHTVKPWLDAHVGLSPPAVDLASDGYALIGGRVDVVGADAVPTLVYRHREHLITLLAAPQRQGMAEVATATPLSAGGFSMVHWTDGAFSYWAVSDMEKAELDDFVARFRAKAVAG